MNPNVNETIDQMQKEYDLQIETLSRELRGSMGPNSDVRIHRDIIKAQKQTLVDLQLRLIMEPSELSKTHPL